MLNERDYPMSINEEGVYHITIDNKIQSIFKMKGITNDNEGYHKITWKTNILGVMEWLQIITLLWTPASYAKDRVGYTMVGFMPEMKGKMIVIYGTYYNETDSIIVIVE